MPRVSTNCYSLLDGFSLVSSDGRISIRKEKLKAICAVFCIANKEVLSRDYLAELLWPDAEPEKARASLRNTLYQAKDIPNLTSDRNTVVFSPLPKTDEVERAVEAFQNGDIAPLQGLDLENADIRILSDQIGLSSLLDEFIRQQQIRIVEKWADALRALLVGEKDLKRAAIVAKALNLLIPADEVAVRKLIQMDIALGNKAAALERYERLWNILDDEFDVEPAPETQSLAVQLKIDNIQLEEIDGSSLRVFVLPFLRVSGLPEQEAILVDAVETEILSELAAIEDWVTIEADTEEAIPIHEAAYLLKGAVTTGLSALRIVLTLKNLSTNRIIWNSSIPLEPNRWLQNSELSIQRLVSRLVGSLERNFVDKLSKKDVPLKEIETMMRANHLMRSWNPDNDQRAEQLMRALLGSDALGLRAKISLAELLNSRALIFPASSSSRNDILQAAKLADECTEIAPDRADAWLARAWARVQLGECSEAKLAAWEALERSSCNPSRLASAAEVLALAGAFKDAKTYSEIVARLDPQVNRVTMAYRVSISLLNQEYSLAVELAEKSGGAIIFGWAYGAIASYCAGKGTKAKAHWRKFEEQLASVWVDTAPIDAAGWLLRNHPVQDPLWRQTIRDTVAKLANT